MTDILTGHDKVPFPSAREKKFYVILIDGIESMRHLDTLEFKL